MNEEVFKPNDAGIVEKVIPSIEMSPFLQILDHVGTYQIEEWLHKSGEVLCGFSLIFHDLNVEPNVKEREAKQVYICLSNEYKIGLDHHFVQ